MKADWVKMKNEGEHIKIFCDRCGDSLSVRLPVGITTLVKAGDGFVADHRNCKEKK
jgi:hypothetical protein